MDSKVWTIPAERSKNGQAHRVPLSPLALELIHQARSHADGARSPFPSLWLFPSPTVDGPVGPLSINHALHKSLPGMGLENLTPHDLRRTAATNITKMGVNRLTVSKILNHVETGVTAIYDRHGYDAEKRHALDAWAAHLEGIVTRKSAASNVVPLATAGDAQ